MTQKSSDQTTQSHNTRRQAGPAGDGLLKREDITPERIAALEKRAASLPGYSLVTQEERDRSRRAFLDGLPSRQDLWVFGYGSLMWNPAIHVSQSEQAKLHGYHRAFCLHLVIGRGTPEAPGLMLGLDRGGSCIGIAHRIAASQVESETEILWLREMIGTGYVPRQVQMTIEGEKRNGLTFVANRASQRYAGRMPFEDAVARISQATGDIGSNRDYLYRTIEKLNVFGLPRGPLHKLEQAVRAKTGET
ncbi:MAG: gamma-glutamylcyclotransferase [Parvibaculum sp.]